MVGDGPRNTVDFAASHSCRKTHVNKISNFPVFYMAPGLNDFDGRIYPLLALSEEVGPEKLDFFGPKWHLLCSLQVRSQISIDFQGPPIKETSRRGPGIFCSRLIWVKGEHFRSIAQEISPSALKIYLRH
jgi:hypothetical protein